MAFEPGKLPTPRDAVGPNRFDDPRPRTMDRYVVRYTGRSLRGCLLELLAWLRPDPAALMREAQVVDDADPGDEGQTVLAAQEVEARAVADFLDGRQVGLLEVEGLVALSINDPALQAELDREPAVRALLDGPEGQAALGGGRQKAHLDEAAVRLSTDLGRDLTRACSLAIRDRDNRPDAIHYRSRHDDAEDCWAIYDHAPVQLAHSTALDPAEGDHREALVSVASLWQLALPQQWMD
ncbi:MAG: RES domain-containing protein [Blastococcus sp.]|nr:RES domain-containing protein [Blastococcus sp.]